MNEISVNTGTWLGVTNNANSRANEINPAIHVNISRTSMQRFTRMTETINRFSALANNYQALVQSDLAKMRTVATRMQETDQEGARIVGGAL